MLPPLAFLINGTALRVHKNAPRQINVQRLLPFGQDRVLNCCRWACNTSVVDQDI